MPTVKEILKDYLDKNGFDGLVGDDCGCCCNDLIPCDGDDIGYCEAGFKRKTGEEDWEWEMVAVKESKTEGEHYD